MPATARGSGSSRLPDTPRRGPGRPAGQVGVPCREMVLLASRRSFVRLLMMRFALLALGGLLVGHQAVYLAQYGDGAALTQAMTSGGHDGYWGLFTTVALSGLLLLLVRSAWRLVELRRASAAEGSVGLPHLPGHVRSYRRELLLLW